MIEGHWVRAGKLCFIRYENGLTHSPSGRGGGFVDIAKVSLSELLARFDTYAEWLDRNPRLRRADDDTSPEMRAEIEFTYLAATGAAP